MSTKESAYIKGTVPGANHRELIETLGPREAVQVERPMTSEIQVCRNGSKLFTATQIALGMERSILSDPHSKMKKPQGTIYCKELRSFYESNPMEKEKFEVVILTGPKGTRTPTTIQRCNNVKIKGLVKDSEDALRIIADDVEVIYNEG